MRKVKKYINDYIAPTIASAMFWCVIWMVSFIVLNIWLNHANIDSKVVAFTITISVICAHLPKIIALILDTDTDFRRDRSWDIANLKFIRIILSISALAIISVYLIPSFSDSLFQPFDPNLMSEFFNATMNNIPICISLGLLQMVFSFPNPKIPNGEFLVSHQKLRTPLNV